MKAGFYPRNFIFLHAVLTGVLVQRYTCKATSQDATFSALAAFQEPHAHYSVAVHGTALERVFADGRSIRSSWRDLRRKPALSFLARSTVSDWCRRFQERVPKLAAVLRAHLGGRLPSSGMSARGDPDSFLRMARAAFGLYRTWSDERFWEWLHDLVVGTSGEHLLSA